MTNLGNKTSESTYAANTDYWLKIIRERLDRYRSNLTDKAVLDAIGLSDGLTILDAGCGEGYLSRILAQAGPRMVGVDTCPDLVESARVAARELGLTIDYYTQSVNDLPITDGRCDKVICNHLINDLPDVSKPFQEFARVMREGGQLVILMLHPCFYGAHNEGSCVVSVGASGGAAQPARA